MNPKRVLIPVVAALLAFGGCASRQAVRFRAPDGPWILSALGPLARTNFSYVPGGRMERGVAAFKGCLSKGGVPDTLLKPESISGNLLMRIETTYPTETEKIDKVTLKVRLDESQKMFESAFQSCSDKLAKSWGGTFKIPEGDQTLPRNSGTLEFEFQFPARIETEPKKDGKVEVRFLKI